THEVFDGISEVPVKRLRKRSDPRCVAYHGWVGPGTREHLVVVYKHVVRDVCVAGCSDRADAQASGHERRVRDREEEASRFGAAVLPCLGADDIAIALRLDPPRITADEADANSRQHAEVGDHASYFLF